MGLYSVLLFFCFFLFFFVLQGCCIKVHRFVIGSVILFGAIENHWAKGTVLLCGIYIFYHYLWISVDSLAGSKFLGSCNVWTLGWVPNLQAMRGGGGLANRAPDRHFYEPVAIETEGENKFSFSYYNRPPLNYTDLSTGCLRVYTDWNIHSSSLPYISMKSKSMSTFLSV